MDEAAHLTNLEKYCRVCGNRIQKAQGKSHPPYLCSEYKGYLEVAFGLDVSQDDPQVHPPTICKACFLTARRAATAKEAGGGYHPVVTPFLWTRHSDDSCQVYTCNICITIGGIQVSRCYELLITGLLALCENRKGRSTFQEKEP